MEGSKMNNSLEIAQNKTFIQEESFIQKILKNRVLTLGLIIVLVSIFSSISWPTIFPVYGNISVLLLGISTDAILAVGMMILLISGWFDLSVGSVVGATGAIAANLMVLGHVNFLIAIAVGLTAAIFMGLINGFLIARVGINPMIQGLAMMGIGRGMALMFVNTGLVTFPDAFTAIGQSVFLGLKTPVWYMIITIALFSILVQKTVFFRRYYYIGGNEIAAALSGIDVKRMKLLGFVLSATLAGIAGIIMTSRMGAANNTAGMGSELRVITACILGGASMKGGKGTVIGALLGTIFMGLIGNVMIIARVGVYWQQIVLGIILILAVSLDSLVKNKNA